MVRYFKSDLIVFTVMGILTSGLTGHTRAEGMAALSVSKIDFYFETYLRVQLKAKIVESEETKLIGSNMSYTQGLTYAGRGSRDAGKTFPGMAELRQWMETEICAETHEVDLKPIRDSRVQGEQTFRGRLKPLMVKVTGKELAAPNRSVSETVVCKRGPKAGS
jgi:hypothetical protein